MVKGLRGAKKRQVEAPKAIPRFVPRETTARGPILIVGGLVLAALCALAFALTILLTPAPHLHVVEQPKPAVVPPATDGALPPPQAPVVQTPNPLPPKIEEKEADSDLKPGTLKIKHAPLLSVLQLISETCGVRIDPAPGMPNPDVVVDYRDMNAMEMLRDLGKQYSFTPLDQHDGSILVVPAVDPNAPSEENTPVGMDRVKKVGG